MPSEEFKEAWQSRRGPWVTAPQSDELWDGERRVFWEKELSSEELRDILRFRRFARYASTLQGLNGIFGIKVPMPKPPLVIEELVRISTKSALENGGKAESLTGLELPGSSSPRVNPRSSVALSSVVGVATGSPRTMRSPSQDAGEGSPRERIRVEASVDNMFSLGPKYEQFEFTNPAMLPSSPAVASGGSSRAKRLSNSQLAAMQNAGKVLRLDSPRLGHAVHQTRSKRLRAQKRRSMHTLLQPWFGLVYFLIPLTILASRYFAPFWRDVFYAWRENRVISTAIEIPWFFERMLRLPDIPFLHSTVYIGLFAFEVTSILYLMVLFVSQLMIFLAVRPLVVSLSSSYSERGAAAN